MPISFLSSATRLVSLAAALVLTSLAHATVFNFDLQGKAGFGLLSGNENNITINGSPGTGGEIGAGISFNDVTSILTVNVGWGSANGFTNLTSNVTMAHIHGPTASSAFTQNAGVLIGLDGAPFTFNNSSTSGFITGSTVLNATNQTALFAGLLYINIHTSTNTGGEIRGNIVNPSAIPEPSTYAALGGLAALGLAFGSRRRRQA